MAQPRRSPSQMQPPDQGLRSLPEPYRFEVGGRAVQVDFFIPADADRREGVIQGVIAQALARKRGKA
jgi:hypothetical protein